jgi:hypothetical protein
LPSSFGPEQVEVGVTHSAVHVTVADPFPAVAMPMVGGSGMFAGFAEVALEGSLVLIAFVAVTTNENVVPFLSPVNVTANGPGCGRVLEVLVVVSVTVYEVTGRPSSLGPLTEQGATHTGTTVTVAILFPGTTCGAAGGSGFLPGVTAGVDGIDSSPVPITFAAVTVNV